MGLPHANGLHQHQPPPNHFPYPLYHHHAGHLGYAGYHGGYSHGAQHPLGEWPGHTQLPPQQNSQDDKGSAGVELATFLGEWRDSMGNTVNVDWAKDRGARGELDVSLSTKSGKTIQLSVKARGGGRFQCGHYNL